MWINFSAVQEDGPSCFVVKSIYAVLRPHYGLFQTRIEATRRPEPYLLDTASSIHCFVSGEAQVAILYAEMQALPLQCLNNSGCQDLPWSLDLGCYIEPTTSPSLESDPGLPLLSKTWVIQLAVVAVLSTPLLLRLLPTTWPLTAPPTPLNGKEPPQMPYLMPVVGNLVSYLLDAAKLASSITSVVPFLPQSLSPHFCKMEIDWLPGKSLGLLPSFGSISSAKMSTSSAEQNISTPSGKTPEVSHQSMVSELLYQTCSTPQRRI